MTMREAGRNLSLTPESEDALTGVSQNGYGQVLTTQSRQLLKAMSPVTRQSDSQGLELGSDVSLEADALRERDKRESSKAVPDD